MSRTRERSWLSGHQHVVKGYSPGGLSTVDRNLVSYEKTLDSFNSEAIAARKLRRMVEKGHGNETSKRVLAWLSEARDLGSEFHSQKNVFTYSGQNIDSDVPYVSGLRRVFHGSVYPAWPTIGNTFLSPSPDSTLFQLGAKAISAVVPNSPHASLGVALGELREGLPSLPGMLMWKDSTLRALPRTASGEYLNMVFGWDPMVKDIHDVATAAEKSDAIWHQFLRDNHKPIRRSFHFSPVRSNVSRASVASYGEPVSVTQTYASPGILTTSVDVYTEQWFSGCFRYHLPERDTRWHEAMRAYQKASLVYGLDISPHTMWNLAPWSWLIDWYVSLGPLLKNLSLLASDGLVMQYGYIMERKVETTTWHLNNLVFENGQICNASLTQMRESKIRLKATPYGFGLDTSKFTPKQWAILAALGMNRV